MHIARGQVIFESRHDAGKRLATKLSEYVNRSVVVLAIPNGGIPVALSVASALNADLDLVICRKVPMLIQPEGSLGAVADNGTLILNEEAVKRIGFSRQKLEYEITKVRAEIKQRSILYQRARPPIRVNSRIVIIIDDGLASGFTMMAAVESVRHYHPKEVVVAVPVAPAAAVKRLEKVADKIITCFTGYMPKFYVSDFYRYWHDVSDDEAVRYLREWQTQRFRQRLERPPKK
jgi:predicted phosphoribosyltransferase